MLAESGVCSWEGSEFCQNMISNEGTFNHATIILYYLGVIGVIEKKRKKCTVDNITKFTL